MKPSVFEPEPGKPEAVHAMGISPSLKLALELGPLGIFFLVNFRGQWLIDHVPLFSSFEKPIFPATAIFMIAIVVALVISWFVARRLPVMPLVSGIFVLVFGALTLWLHDSTFIKMKPTIINTLFALILFGGLVFKKPLLGYALDSALNLDAEGWRKLTFRWAFFFLFLAVVNEIIWRNFSETFWLSFRFFGNMVFTIIFLGLQMPLLMRHSVEEQGKTREAVFTKPAARPENKETPTRKKPSSGQS